MSTNLQQKAISFCELKKLQKKLATTGQYEDAIALGKKIDPHAVQVAQEYLNIKELPEGPNGTLVREIAVEAASVANGKSMVEVKLRGALRRAAWSENVSTIKKLEDAKAALPDLSKVVAVLQ